MSRATMRSGVSGVAAAEAAAIRVRADRGSATTAGRVVHWSGMEPQTLACRIGAGLSTAESAGEAATEAARRARGGGAFDSREVDLAFAFLSPSHLDGAAAAAAAVREELAPRHLLGCVA